MKLPLLCFSLAALVLLSSSLTAAESTGDVTAIRVVRTLDKHPGSAKLWEPYIAQWKPKHLVVAFGVGVPGKVDMGDLMASISTDDGDTWGEPVTIFNHRERQGAIQFAYANPILYHPPGQDVIWCFGMRCPMNYRHSEDSHLVAAYSADGGRSWNQVELAMNYTGPLIVVAGIFRVEGEDGQIRYLLPAHRNTKRNDPLGTRDHLILESTSLLEWSLAGFVPQPEQGPRVFLHEGSLSEGDRPGEIKMIMRTADYEDERLTTDPPRAFSTVSNDGGRTWSPARQEPDLWNAKSKAFFGQSDDGTRVYVYNDGPASSRMSLRYKLQSPGGDWGPERTFYDAGIKNSYPTLIEVAPGDFRAVWDSGTATRSRTFIQFGKFKISPAK